MLEKVLLISGFLILSYLGFEIFQKLLFLETDTKPLRASFRLPELVPYPSGNPYSVQKEHLGRKLFMDPLLSGSGQMSCASCHQPNYFFTERLARAIGENNHHLPRRSPSLLNVAFGTSFFWDGRAKTLEEQSLIPIESPDEMNLKLSELIKRLRGNPEYISLFSQAFPGEGITTSTIAKALATFERGLVSVNSAFDRWVSGEENAISAKAQKGFLVFNYQAKCVTCHSGWNFTNGSFADTGVTQTDLGRGKVVQLESLNHAFKTPTLRDVSARAPYMHNGSLQSLEEVVEHYNKGGTFVRNSTKLFIQPLNLNLEEKSELIEFLKTLKSESRQVASQ